MGVPLNQALEEFRCNVGVVLLELDISPPVDMDVWNRYQMKKFQRRNNQLCI